MGDKEKMEDKSKATKKDEPVPEKVEDAPAKETKKRDKKASQKKSK